MIKVGITGQKGFIGKHLVNLIKTKTEEIEIIPFQRTYFKESKKLCDFVQSCDVIVHIAAMNRHENEQVIYDTNLNLVKKLIESCEKTKSNPKIIFSSSTQEEKNNFYGKSKREGRELFESWAKKTGNDITTLIIPNVFGPFGKPNYNSFIATFCDLLVKDKKPTVLNDSVVNLIYINELTEIFFTEIINNLKGVRVLKVDNTSSKKVSEILLLLLNYKKMYIDLGQIPNVPKKSFELNLFNTFISYIPKNFFPRNYTKHIDNRGAFVEIIRTEVSGQSSYSLTVPGITRGNHYHTRKIERFAVIKGKAAIKIRKVDSEEVIEYFLDGEKPAYVDMPIWYTHNITNIGNSELITLFWINEPYNPDDTDTYFVEV
ncbi:epimerase [Tenacibaculum sp. E3R01]|uniref:polysaccharide biosynthesis C-terminal domain-containing protein n=1 Tax=Tenacibaculum sp. E3R01 TaxID=2267227 RepID=UPI000DEBADCD|nr:NAD-dependent epimerase/dehydratase family protein [Tenacibaculum sp. E3R01]RBW54373.1 epimerase [Tenacibaculum sp. E3R01]